MTKKGDPYFILTVGDGINSKTIRIFQPLVDKVKEKLEKEAMYVAYFSKNDKGFINVDSRRKFEKFG